MLEKCIKDGSAFNKFLEMVKAQDGDIEYILHPEKFPLAKSIVPIYAKEEGKNIHELRLEKSGAAVIYNVDLVDELAQRFKLDFSTSPTLHFSEWEPIDGAQAVAIKAA